MLAYIPAPWILWDIISSTVSEYRFDANSTWNGTWDVLSLWEIQLRKNYVRRVAPFCIAGVVAIPTWNADCFARIIWSGLLKIPLVSPCFTTTKSRGTICVFASIKKPSQHVLCPTSTPLYIPMVYDTILYWCSGRKWDGPYDSLAIWHHRLNISNRLGSTIQPGGPDL